MSRSSGRAQVEPLVALVAVAAVCLGLSLYAGVLDDVLRDRSERATPETVADRALAAVAPAGVARPALLPEAAATAPDGYRVNATLLTGDRRFAAGPAPPAGARTATRPTGVRVAPGDVRPGALRVVVWR